MKVKIVSYDLPVKTQSGEDVEIIKTDAKLHDGCSVIGIVEGTVETWTFEGKYLPNSEGSSGNDLMPNLEVDSLTVAEVIENAEQNFEKLQCIAGPFDTDCSYETSIGTRCIIGWSIEDPAGLKGSLNELLNDEASHVRLADNTERNTLVSLQLVHDRLVNDRIPLSVRSAVIRTALNMAKARLLTDDARINLIQVATTART